MDDAELIGGVILDCADPRVAAMELAQLLSMHDLDRSAVIRAGFEPELVDVLRRRLDSDLDRLTVLCQEAAAWVLGRRSVTLVEPWELVASLPGDQRLPNGLRRTTGETLIQLIAQARATLRLAAPFIDRSGLSFISEALASATSRGVALQVFMPTRSTDGYEAIHDLGETIASVGDHKRFVVLRMRPDAPWAHLKVLTCDSHTAYIGSANVTGAAIAGPNLELGVLVRGDPVATVERILDMYREG